ncbi:MAG: aldo/keto reductase [Gammaproteobacteria bacterium]
MMEKELPRRVFVQGRVATTVLGFGGAPIGNLYAPVEENAAIATIHAAHAAGLRYFDTAPYYGYGLSEERMGRALEGTPRDSLVISTKVGRLVVGDPHGESPGGHFAISGRGAKFDYSRAGILRSFEGSLRRLRTDYIDILLLHDVGHLTHGSRHREMLAQALDESLPAMEELKRSGACRAIGIGVNEQAVCLELMSLVQLDCIMLAGRYTLLEQSDSVDVMSAAQTTSVAIIAAAPFNSGLLAHPPAAGDTYNYGPAGEHILRKAQQIHAVCVEHNVDVGAAALQFPLAHPSVISVVAGVRSVDEAAGAARRLAAPIPAALWRTLLAKKLIRPGTRVPQ